MAPDTQSIDRNATFLTLGTAVWHPLESLIDEPGYPGHETLSAATKRVDPGDEEDEDEEVEDEDDELVDDDELDDHDL